MKSEQAGEESEQTGEAAPAAPARHEQEARILRAILDNLDVGVFEIAPDGAFIFHDGRGLAPAGIKPGQFLGRNMYEMYPEAGRRRIQESLTTGKTHEVVQEAFGRHWKNWLIPARSSDGEIRSVIGVSLDITELKRAQQEAEARLQAIAQQRKVIRELATPIIEVWEGVLALPMIGVIDSARTAEVMDALLQAVVQRRARFAVLDLTGVEAVDTQTAGYLIHLIRAVGLLGAEGIVTGIRPGVAQTLVAIGVDLGTITTLANLRAGLRHCIARMTGARGWRSAPSSGKVGASGE